ncbi:tRNA1(Val) (adenine(37)-N6)-methyltransferase [Devosia crocina]|uniref:tRNA1(Val) (adenine(37)-N6)-methyltransferase n=1 Tax=Devosia crocina TaxID=429728 RepID=UPI000AE46C04|nr:methyltransferase [Devosia crocina]
MLLGASVPEHTSSLLDLGAGVGTAGLVALALDRAQSTTLLERHEETAEMARRNAVENGFAARCEILCLDILASGITRRAAGLRENNYRSVIANPPFFGAGQGTLAPQASRADARHMGREALDGWVRCAAGAAAGGGDFTIVYPASGLADILGAMEGRFGALTVLPLAPRAGQAASRVLVRGIKGSRTPLTLLATRALHEQSGRSFAPEFDAIFRGQAALVW